VPNGASATSRNTATLPSRGVLRLARGQAVSALALLGVCLCSHASSRRLESILAAQPTRQEPSGGLTPQARNASRSHRRRTECTVRMRTGEQ